MPPRGPLRVLWVEDVMTWALPTGVGCTFAAISPEICAISARSTAPTSSAIWRARSKSHTRGYAVAPTIINLGRVIFA